MQDGLQLGSKFVGSEISCDKPKEENKSSIKIPSAFVLPSGHHNWEWPLKSPV